MLCMDETRRVVLYMCTYISSLTKLVPVIDQVYQQISLKSIQIKLTAKVSNTIWLEEFLHITFANTYR